MEVGEGLVGGVGGEGFGVEGCFWGEGGEGGGHFFFVFFDFGLILVFFRGGDCFSSFVSSLPTVCV